jgi:hypothetical protein
MTESSSGNSVMTETIEADPSDQGGHAGATFRGQRWETVIPEPRIVEGIRSQPPGGRTVQPGHDGSRHRDKYLRDTVLLASVLFLVAIAQRLRVRSVRVGLNVVAFGILVFGLTEPLSLPRL